LLSVPLARTAELPLADSWILLMLEMMPLLLSARVQSGCSNVL
jgi:hypothetical protein